MIQTRKWIVWQPMMYGAQRKDKVCGRTPLLPREASCFLILRKRFGYSINVMSKVFHRSPAVIHRILKWNESLGVLAFRDLRKLPRRVKALQNARQYRTLMIYLEAWSQWIISEEGKPP